MSDVFRYRDSVLLESSLNEREQRDQHSIFLLHTFLTMLCISED